MMEMMATNFSWARAREIAAGMLTLDQTMMIKTIFMFALWAITYGAVYVWAKKDPGKVKPGQEKLDRDVLKDARRMHRLFQKNTQGASKILSWAFCAAVYAGDSTGATAAVSRIVGLNMGPSLNTVAYAIGTLRVARLLNDYLHDKLCGDLTGVDKKTARNITKFFDGIVYTLGAYFVVDSIQLFDMKNIAASLGVFSLAVSLASQEVIKDIMAYLSIMISHPFFKGDYIITGKEAGWVEAIQMRRTLIRDDAGLLMAVPNKDLLSKVVSCRERMPFRQHRMTFVISSKFDVENLDAFIAKVPEMIREVIPLSRRIRDVRYRKRTQDTRCRITSFDNMGVKVEVQFYVDNIKKPGAGADSFLRNPEFKDIVSTVNLKLLYLLKEHRLSLASSFFTRDNGLRLESEVEDMTLDVLATGEFDENDGGMVATGAGRRGAAPLALGLSGRSGAQIVPGG
eukprot:CAMPEP_0182853530 /NCGR_PEP_ID=MMETSP0034_2-20130328/748_1 /TAXON_ID=156128 /ORGANISM="Nephroselmis pyriformis, Strain CCMP717" /LENGTH=454 /DNA_ID=CAMNT_0024984305 /DNA_START=147 /DNA_END=1507 /DNA_ORIENTATION=+